MKIKAEYIWIDGKTPTSKLRSKTKIMEQGTEPPIWGFDGSSTEQATGMDAATAAATAAYVGSLLPNAALTNFALTDTGIIASYQGALITLPGLSAVTGIQLEGNRYPLSQNWP